MISRRFKYKLKALLNPRCWIRVGRYDPEWDQWLWNSLELGLIEAVAQHNALIDGTKVWVANHPYGSGGICDRDTPPSHRKARDRITCSRATALLLGDELKSARVISRLKFKYNHYGQIEYNGHLIG